MIYFITKLLNRNRDFKIEMRKEPRYRAVRKFRIEFKRGFQRETKLAEGRNISKKGLRFATPFYVRKGDKIEMNFIIEKGRYTKREKVIPITAKVTNAGRPRGAHRYRAGCRFLKVLPEHQKELESFVSWIKSLQPA